MENKMSGSIKIIPQVDGVMIGYEWGTVYKKEGNLFSCYIPTIDTTFTAQTEEEIKDVSISICNAFLDYWIVNFGLSRLSVELKRLGFKTDRDAVVMFALRNSKRIKADFTAETSMNDNSYDQKLAISGTPIRLRKIHNCYFLTHKIQRMGKMMCWNILRYLFH